VNGWQTVLAAQRPADGLAALRPADGLAAQLPADGSAAQRPALPSLAEDTARNPAALEAALDLIEGSLLEDFRSAAPPTTEAERIATALGRADLVMRARLIAADIQGRRGDVAELGKRGRIINAWAYEHRHTYLIARSHRLLSIFFRRIGDAGEALAHALRCVEHTTDDMAPRIRAGHYMTLALVLDINGSYADARERFNTAFAIAQNDPAMSLAVLNNMAYTAYEIGDKDAAVELVERMRGIARTHRVVLDGLYLDTIARVELLLERYVAVEETLRPVLEDPSGPLDTDGDVLPTCLVTATEALRRRGLLERAQLTLDEARRLCDERGLPAVTVDVQRQQAEIFAAAGRFQEAYEEYRRYHTSTEALRSAEREARARALQATLEAEEARRDRERYRQLALHDALTGLHNRRYVDEFFATTLGLAASQGTSTSVALLDLDHFKCINDTLSHEVGDDVLRQVGTLLVGAVPAPGLAARLGGEEFVLVLPDTSAAQARRIAEAARQAIRTHEWTGLTGRLNVTVSVGVATAVGTTTQSALLGQADRNLYRAKRNGRDQLVADD
jgi:two-component system cell cycle response regulator